MKKLKNLLTIALLVLLSACSKDSDIQDPVTNLLITNISPTTGPKNTAVTITGTGFSTTAASNSVTINGKVCPITSNTATQINITIPPSVGSGKIKVVVGDANSESENFDFVVTTTVTTIAGSASGFADGQGSTAQFDNPKNIVIDALGNLFVVDGLNHKIRKISPTGLVSTFAGSISGFADGQGMVAQFNFPEGIAIDDSGNLFVTDRGNNKIRKISPTGLVSTLAGSTEGFSDGPGINAQFRDPLGIIVTNTGNLFVADFNNAKIRKISPIGFVSTVAGNISGYVDGQGLAAKFSGPTHIAIDAEGNLFVSEQTNNKIRKISPTGLVSTFAGSTPGFADGQGTLAQFNRPAGITIDTAGNLYIIDNGNNKIRKISPTGMVTTVAGGSEGFNDGNATTGQFKFPRGITIDTQGNLYVADGGNHKIRKITFD